jgi:hypothetical protein
LTLTKEIILYFFLPESAEREPGGIYRGLIQEATLIIDRSGADIRVVQRNTKGQNISEK